jgi:hypothetical protein
VAHILNEALQSAHQLGSYLKPGTLGVVRAQKNRCVQTQEEEKCLRPFTRCWRNKNKQTFNSRVLLLEMFTKKIIKQSTTTYVYKIFSLILKIGGKKNIETSVFLAHTLPLTKLDF